MKLYGKLLLSVAIATCCFLQSEAVTDAEMEQARAIAAKNYLRYINNNSSYLESINPTSISNLKEQLKETEKENLKAFEAIKPAGDYSSWSKEQLVAYWGGTFFDNNASSLKKDATGAWVRNAVKKQVSNMTVAPPAPTPSAEEEVATQPSDQQTEPEAQNGIPEELLTAEEIATTAEELAETGDEMTEDDQAEEAEATQSESSGTWVYIMILCILVAAVIALVIYAAKTMKSQKSEGKPAEGSLEENRRNMAYLDENNKLREKFAENLAAKNEEIRGLGRKISELEGEVVELRAENKRLRKENERLQVSSVENVRQPEQFREEIREPRRHPASESSTSAAPAQEIYLGRVNTKGIFVRADRRQNPGHSVYRLSTTNGVTGTFTVVNDPMLLPQELESPEIWLAGGCVAKDITDTVGRSFIETEAPGTAVFEDGAWRVLRKAKIRYD